MAERTKPSTHRPEETEKRRSHRVKPKAQEKKVALVVGGRRQGGSGSHEDAKGDAAREGSGYIQDFPLLVECKRTTLRANGHGKSISVKAEWLAKITREAFNVHKHPALAIQFDKEVMDKLARQGLSAETDWVMFPATTVQAIFEALGQEGPDFG